MTRTLHHRGHKITQTDYNCHYRIFDKYGNMVMHCSCNKMLTTDGLRNAIDMYLDTLETNDDLIDKLLEEEYDYGKRNYKYNE